MFDEIRQEINTKITTNGVGAITGAILNNVLNDMLGAICYIVEVDYRDNVITQDTYKELEKASIKMALVHHSDGDRFYVMSFEDQDYIRMTCPLPTDHGEILTLKVAKAAGRTHEIAIETYLL